MHKKENKISVICVQDNNFDNLEIRLDNIKNQRYVNEVFIISNKNKEIEGKYLKTKYAETIIYFKSEFDSLIETINQTIKEIKNEFFVILDSSEYFYEDSFNIFLDSFSFDNGVALVYGNSISVDPHQNFLGFNITSTPERFLENVKNISGITLGSFLLRKSLFKKFGFFDKKFKHHYLLEFLVNVFGNDLKYIKFTPNVIIHKYVCENDLDKFINLEKNLELLELAINTSNDMNLDVVTKNILSSSVLLNDKEIDSILHKNNYSDFTITKFNVLRNELRSSLNDFNNSKFLKSIPHDLKIILESRLDLQKQGFNLQQNERKLCQWIIKYGFKEYPPLRKNNCNGSTLHWLKNNSCGENISRMNLAIFDANKIFRKVYKLIKFRTFQNQFISFVWPFLPYDLPSQSFYYGFEDTFLIFRKIVKKFKVTLELKRNVNYPTEGVNLIGYAKHALGIGEDLRSTFFALDQVEINTSIINFPPGAFKGREENTLGRRIKNIHPYNTTILCLTAEESLRYFMKVGTREFKNKYIIGYWPWELPRWPKNWKSAIDYVNEIWVSSQHIRDSLKGETHKPVRIMPLCIDQPNFQIKQQSVNQRIINREKFNLEKKSVYLCFSFDQNSYMERKNPWDSLRAFQMAFPPIPIENINNQIKLLIKTFPNKTPSYEWEKLKRVAELDSRIKIIEKNMTRYDLLDLYGCCDIFISLHRAEGYGRCLAEALQLGLDLIATDWSGNTDFCKGLLYHPVPFELKPVNPFDYPYWQNQFWAEPDLIAAATILRKVVKKRIEKGLPDIEISKSYQNTFSASKCGARYRRRLSELNLINANSEIF